MMRGIRIKVDGDNNLGIRYKSHVQTYGWQDWKKDGEMSGTEKQAKRLEAIQIVLVDKELREMYRLASRQGINSQTPYDKAFLITQYIGTVFEYHDGSYSAESMIDTRGGTCFGYADLTYCFARKLGLLDTWLTVPGRNVNHGFRYYGSLHRTAITKIDGNEACADPLSRPAVPEEQRIFQVKRLFRMQNAFAKNG